MTEDRRSGRIVFEHHTKCRADATLARVTHVIWNEFVRVSLLLRANIFPSLNTVSKQFWMLSSRPLEDVRFLLKNPFVQLSCSPHTHC